MARPTNRLHDITTFYGDLLGLQELHRGEADGWTAVMFGLPGDQYNLEFVAHTDGIDGEAPTRENLLVFYFGSADEQAEVAERLRNAGTPEVELDNPWWERNSACAFLDPDSWHVVLMPTPVMLSQMESGSTNS
ncbi:VOC family protein [Brachybacterium sacelli]|uniref:Catechol 2,3-dioxygenase-like lactoylglutathione lyase family enzyme n=2 Tax=Brachybacterium sacelli TaxID=173364 RepID=A0ABS4X7A3_9MICO|nr:VOC family protein [Brachybacterium sacelli]MBP2384352.1 catechol 2,3-dioxygenase-like lactoylglutathione lyase family enzyme [Brachybacterium sacelli]